MVKVSSNSKKYILVIDAGTQSIRATFIDLNGTICELERTIIEPYYSDKPGFAEQDPEYYWKMLCKTTQNLIKNSSIDQSNILGATITTQRGTVINLDKDNKPLRPAIVWLDQRKAKVDEWPKWMTKQGLRVVKMHESLTHAIKDGESNWIRQNQPEVWKKTHKHVFLSGFFIQRLTGKFVDSVGSTVGFVPFDYKKQRWAKKNGRNNKLFPVERDKLVDLVKPSELLGYITEEASKKTGIPKGMPLIAAASDKACEVLGSGCMTPEIACLSYGTTATIQTVNPKYTEIVRFFPSYPSAIPDYHNTEVMIYRGYWMISWFKKEFGCREVQLAKELGKEPEELLDDLIADIPPGSMGLMSQPYWSPGVKIPGIEAKGSIIGFGDVHTRAHIYRSILEGLGYALKEGAIRTQKKTKIPIEKIRVSGGGAQSKDVLQLTADIFDLPVEKAHTIETSALGAAINAAVGLKAYPDFETAISNMVHIGETYYPKPENRDIYQKLFYNVYLKMYKKLRPLYNEIRDIINYPEKIE